MPATSEPIRVMVVDDHPLVCDGLGALIGQRPDMRLVGQAADGPGAVGQYRRLRPDVTIMDIGLGQADGVEVIRAIRAEFPAARFLVLTMRLGDEDVHRALRAGAQGYLSKETPWEEIARALIAVHGGKKVIGPQAAAALADRMNAPELTNREAGVLAGMVRGDSNRQIAGELGITEATVKAHVTKILAKLGVAQRTQAVAQALLRGLVRPGGGEPGSKK